MSSLETPSRSLACDGQPTFAMGRKRTFGYGEMRRRKRGRFCASRRRLLPSERGRVTLRSAPRRLLAGLLLLAASAFPAAAQQQIVDPDFPPSLTKPAYTAGGGPAVGVDQAHNNFHTIDGQYRPFADLLRLDGYRVVPSTHELNSESLRAFDILVIANARADPPTSSAFSEAECLAVVKWVKGGGALLLIADHPPFGWAADRLAGKFGVVLGKGWTYEPDGPSITTQILFSRKNGGLGDHPILEGRDRAERIALVRTFTGESLSVPPEASVLLRLSPLAREAPLPAELNAAAAAAADSSAPAPGNTFPVGGHAQGLAMQVGRGRLVVFGEAAMFSAQAIIHPPGSGQADLKFGMNVPGTDDQQLALNVLHWLSGLLDP